jgi:hypothetical protein
LVSTFWMPADSTTARTAPPAMMPVPSGAGFQQHLAGAEATEHRVRQPSSP